MAGPLYRQIADDLRRNIQSGVLAVGEQLPTEDELMKTHNASRNTVRAALKELTTRGLVYTRHGKGTFIAESVSPIVTTLTSDPKTGRGGGEGIVYTAEVAASGRSASTSDPRVEIRKASPAVAHSLKMRDGSEVITRRQERYVDGLPWSLQTSYYPRGLLTRAPRLLDTDDFEEGTVAYLAECGIRQIGYRDALEFRSPNEQETAYFDLPADGHIQVVEIHRIAFDPNGQRVRLTITVYRADRNRFVINVGNVPMDDELLGPGDDNGE